MNPKTTQKQDADAMIREIYNAFMVDHEIDLMTENIPLLDEWYKGETQEERVMRFQWYEQVLAEFDARFHDFTDLVKNHLVNMRTEIMKKSTKKEKQRLQEIEKSFDDQ